MYVTATEFRTNVGKYLDLALKEDIYILRHGRPIVMVSASNEMKKKILDSLSGIGGTLEKDPEDILMERLND